MSTRSLRSSCRTSAERPRTRAAAVLFTGRDPILQSPFRLGACMAIPAMASGVGAAAIWRERTGQAQELSIDLRQALYGIAPWVRFLADYNIAAGTLPPGWLPAEWTWDPTVNGRNIQAPFLLGNPLGFQVFETKDGRMVTPTGLYPHHFIGFLSTDPRRGPNRGRSPPDLAQFGRGGTRRDGRRSGHGDGHPPHGRGVVGTSAGADISPALPVIEIIKIGDSEPYPLGAKPDAAAVGNQGPLLQPRDREHARPRARSRNTARRCSTSRAIRRFEHEGLIMDVNVGMRSTMLDLKNPEPATGTLQRAASRARRVRGGLPRPGDGGAWLWRRRTSRTEARHRLSVRAAPTAGRVRGGIAPPSTWRR